MRYKLALVLQFVLVFLLCVPSYACPAFPLPSFVSGGSSASSGDDSSPSFEEWLELREKKREEENMYNENRAESKERAEQAGIDKLEELRREWAASAASSPDPSPSLSPDPSLDPSEDSIDASDASDPDFSIALTPAPSLRPAEGNLSSYSHLIYVVIAVLAFLIIAILFCIFLVGRFKSRD